MFVDLHIHSCLSPCADNDMTPANICGMAYLKGLGAISVTDHNCAENLPYVKIAADHYGLLLLPGLEITTKEEVHLLAYFADVDTAVMFGRMIKEHLPPIHNNPFYFGDQIICNESDDIIKTEESLLIGATDISLADCTRFIQEKGGTAVPAHINRGTNGLLVNMGLLPEEPVFRTLEVSPDLPVPESATKGKLILHSSDAHVLGNISEALFEIGDNDHSANSLLEIIKNDN